MQINICFSNSTYMATGRIDAILILCSNEKSLQMCCTLFYIF